jgi:hypothetical protein
LFLRFWVDRQTNGRFLNILKGLHSVHLSARVDKMDKAITPPCQLAGVADTMMTNTNSEEATALARTVLPKMTEFPSYTWLIEASRRLNIPYHTVASAFIEENNRLKASTVGLSSAIISTPEELEAAKRELEATVRKAAPISDPVRVKKGYWPDGIEEVLATINKKK